MGAALAPPLDGKQRHIDRRAGPLSCYVSGDGPPMLLVHSINAAASAYEVRPIYNRLKTTHTVYAPDLPGFGLSDRSPRDYTIGLYVDALFDVLDLIESSQPGQKIDALALSLSCEFLARASLSRTGSLRSLAFVSPTAFNRGSDRYRAEPGKTRSNIIASTITSLPVVSEGLFRLLAKPAVVRYFLKRTFGSAAFDEGLAAYDTQSAAQENAHHAPLAFLSGRLFSADIRNVYESLTLPVWLSHGDRGDFQDYSQATSLQHRGNWSIRAYESGALPHFDMPDTFVADYRAFLESVA